MNYEMSHLGKQEDYFTGMVFIAFANEALAQLAIDVMNNVMPGYINTSRDARELSVSPAATLLRPPKRDVKGSGLPKHVTRIDECRWQFWA